MQKSFKVFDIPSKEASCAVHVVVGSYHLQCLASTPELATRQKALNVLQEQLPTFGPLEPGMPVARMLVGDDNWEFEEAKAALQRNRDLDPLWEVYATPSLGSGDHIAWWGQHCL